MHDDTAPVNQQRAHAALSHARARSGRCGDPRQTVFEAIVNASTDTAATVLTTSCKELDLLITVLTLGSHSPLICCVSVAHREIFGAKDVARLQVQDSVIDALAMHTGATRAVRTTTESLRDA
jgi:hypothetical protein